MEEVGSTYARGNSQLIVIKQLSKNYPELSDRIPEVSDKILQDPALSGIGQIIWIWLWIKQNTTFCYLVSGKQDDITICATPIIIHLKRSWICNISAVKECFFWPILQAKNCTSLKRAFSAYTLYGKWQVRSFGR